MQNRRSRFEFRSGNPFRGGRRPAAHFAGDRGFVAWAVLELDIESRRAHERDLIGHYLDRLTAALEDLETFSALAG